MARYVLPADIDSKLLDSPVTLSCVLPYFTNNVIVKKSLTTTTKPHTSHPKFQIHLRQMILAIENAVSLVGMNDTNHGKRVGFIANQLGAELNWSQEKQYYLFDLGLLHDCGVSTEQMHADLVNHFDWNDAHVHCEIGYNLLKHFEPLAMFAKPILHHHTPWEILQQPPLGDTLSEDERQMANGKYHFSC